MTFIRNTGSAYHHATLCEVVVMGTRIIGTQTNNKPHCLVVIQLIYQTCLHSDCT